MHILHNYVICTLICVITWLNESCLTSLIALFWNFLLFWNFPQMIYNFLLLFSHSKNIRMSILITIIITYWLLIIVIMITTTKSHNNYHSVGVMELCLLNLLILTDCFLCNSYPCVLFESLPHVINQKPHVYSWNLGKIYLVQFLKFWNLLVLRLFHSGDFKISKSELSKFIPNFPLKHVVTSTNIASIVFKENEKLHRCKY